MKNLLIFLTTLIVSYAILEFGFRVYSDYVSIYDLEMHKYALKIKKRSEVKGLTHEHIPNSEAQLMGQKIAINNHGFRDSDLTNKKQNEHRTMVVGSSITMGWGVPYDSVFTQRLEYALNENQDSIFYNIYNTGIGNYNTVREYVLFSKNLEEVQPDKVVLHYFINDAEVLPEGNANFFVKHSYVLALLYVRVQQFMAVNESNFSTIGQYYLDLYGPDSKGWEETRAAILKFKEECQKKNISFTVLIQPDLHDLASNSDQRKCHDIIIQFLTESDISYLDLFEAFSNNVKEDPSVIWVNSDDPHPDSKGHEIIFQSMEKGLVK